MSTAQNQGYPNVRSQLHYAENVWADTHLKAELQTIVETFPEACKRIDLRLNRRVIYQFDPWHQIDLWQYRWCYLSMKAYINDEILHGLQCTRLGFGKVYLTTIKSWSTKQQCTLSCEMFLRHASQAFCKALFMHQASQDTGKILLLLSLHNPQNSLGRQTNIHRFWAPNYTQSTLLGRPLCSSSGTKINPIV